MSEFSDWLGKLGLERYISIFEENGIDSRALPYLTEEDLKEMQVLLGHRRILLAGINALESGLHQNDPSGGGNRPDEDLVSQSDTSSLQGDAADEQRGAERRQVTILFADLAGYTRLSNALDAEEVHQILGYFFDSSDAIIRGHGGTIDKHLGDCVMAIFGAPVAHGNDPLRAVQAAHNIQASMPKLSLQAGHKLEVHIGIASGQVVASGVGKDAHYTVTGDSVNLASRLADAASAGETFISRQVQLSVSNDFLLGDGVELDVKGFEEPLPVYVLKGQHASARQLKQRPFVGRQAELRQISGLLEACVSSGAGQVVYVRGEAGIGKTRLTEKVADVARQTGYTCHRALVLDFGMSQDQNVIRTLLNSLLTIAPDAEQSLRLEAVDHAVGRGLLEERQRLFLNEMLGIAQPKYLSARYDAMDNTTRQQGKLEMVTHLIASLSRDQPQFILIEDIHWAGKSVLSYLTKIAGSMVDTPFMLLMTSRIEGDPLGVQWQAVMGATPFVSIDLKPLRHCDAMSLAADYFDSSKQFALDCVARADGNPLFLEQLLRNAEEAGENQVPGSVQSIVQARLDAIDDEDKNAVQAASVLGKRFFLSDLCHMLDDPDYAVTKLLERQLIKPELDGRAFLFSHALVQEAIYQSLLKNKRSELHRHAAALYAESEPELCARHLDRAGDDAASVAYLRAAQVHYDEQRFEPAYELLELGLAAVENEGVRVDLQCLKGDVLRQLGQAEASIDVFKQVLDAVPGTKQECRARIGLAEGLRIVDRQQEALSVLEYAQQLAEAGSMKDEQGYIHYLRGNLNFMLGYIDTCLDEHQKALVCSDESDSQTGKALAFGGLGDAYYLRGHMRSALDQFESCGEVCQTQGYGKIEVTNRHMAGWCRIYLMDYVAARADALVAIEMAADVKQQRAEVLGLKLAGLVEIEMGMLDQALVHLSTARDLARQLQAGNFEAQALVLLSRLHAASGDLALALTLSAEAEVIVRKVGMAFIGPIVLAQRSELSLDRQVQKRYINEAEQLLDAGCVSHNHFWVARSAIEINLQRKNWSEVERIAQRLECYTADQPLEWSDFVIARGRALAAWEQGDHGVEIRDHLQALSAQASMAKMLKFSKAIETALASVA